MAQVVVQPGDSWASIAGQYMGDQRQLGALIQANPGGLMLHPGQVLNVPDKPGAVDQATLNSIIGALKNTPFPNGGNLWSGSRGATPTNGGGGAAGGGGGGGGTSNTVGGGRGGNGNGRAVSPGGPGQQVPDAGTQGIQGYLQAHGVGGQPNDIPTGGFNTTGMSQQAVPDAETQGVAQYLIAHGADPTGLSGIMPGGIQQGPMAPGNASPTVNGTDPIALATSLMLRPAQHARQGFQPWDVAAMSGMPSTAMPGSIYEPYLGGGGGAPPPPPPGTNWLYQQTPRR